MRGARVVGLALVLREMAAAVQREMAAVARAGAARAGAREAGPIVTLAGGLQAIQAEVKLVNKKIWWNSSSHQCMIRTLRFQHHTHKKTSVRQEVKETLVALPRIPSTSICTIPAHLSLLRGCS